MRIGFCPGNQAQTTKQRLLQVGLHNITTRFPSDREGDYKRYPQDEDPSLARRANVYRGGQSNANRVMP